MLKRLQQEFDRLGVPYLVSEPMARHTTFRVGGKAALVAQPRSAEELVRVLELYRLHAISLPLCVLGNGSNVLISDSGIDGLVVLTGGVRRVTFSDPVDGKVSVSAECGVSLTALSDACVRQGRSLDGLAFAYGIPGSVGGAVVMNAGAYGGEMSDVVTGCTYLDMTAGTMKELTKQELDLSYRHSALTDHPEWIVLTVEMLLPQGNRADIRAKMDGYMASRRDKQPLEYPSAGSVFKRPVGAYAGKLIEDCGLKGYTVGGAQVSPKHAGFIVNVDNATAADICELVAHIQKTVEERTGYRLECEIRTLGR
jgi:UDP-N-acetylmuramate dehydrogenase